MAILLLSSTFILLFSTTTCVPDGCHVLQREGTPSVVLANVFILIFSGYWREISVSLIYEVDEASFPDQSSLSLFFHDVLRCLYFFSTLVNHTFLICFSPQDF